MIGEARIKWLVEEHLNICSSALKIRSDDSEDFSNYLYIEVHPTGSHLNICDHIGLDTLLQALQKEGFVQKSTRVMWCGISNDIFTVWCVSRSKR